jgi:hypothetical protein
MEISSNSTQVFYCENAIMITSQAPMQRVDVCLVGTQNYVFALPKKSVGFYMVMNTVKTHQLFQGKTIEEGARELIARAEDVQDLEKSFSNLLENDEKYVYRAHGNLSFKFRGLFGKHTLRIGITRMKWSSFGPSKSADSKRFRAFYGQ